MIKQTTSVISDQNDHVYDFYKSEEDDDDEDDNTNNKISIKPGGIIQERFLVQELIGEGSFGQVYKVVDQKQNNQIMAIKVEDESEETSMLEREIKVLIEMRKKTGFPQIKFYGQERGYIYCIMGLLGRNLDSLMQRCGGKFTVSAVLRIAIQILNRIELLHGSRFIHRDIKPDNFVLGYGNQTNVIHIIDFGLSKYFQNSKGEHIPSCKKSGLIGTARYASINAHDEQEQSRRDDLESIGYILIYMATGTLPWMNLQIESKEQKYAQIHQYKKTIKIDQLCQKLPKCFHSYMLQVKSLSFKQQPNYKDLRLSFQDELDRIVFNTKPPFLYDWEQLSEYQIKKKHMSVHVMQTFEENKNQNIVLVASISDGQEKDQQSTHKVKKPLLNIEMKDQIQEKKRQAQSPGKQTNSPTRKGKKPIMINIIEVQHPFEGGQQQYQTNEQLLNQSQQTVFDQNQQFQRKSVATSRMTNYGARSEEIESEGTLPIWNVSKAEGILSYGILSQELKRGIKKPTVIVQRKQNKALTQVQTLKNISKTFVSPKSMNIQGDDSVLDDVD